MCSRGLPFLASVGEDVLKWKFDAPGKRDAGGCEVRVDRLVWEHPLRGGGGVGVKNSREGGPGMGAHFGM